MSETISAIVAVRDTEKYIGAALDSVLGQTRPPDEVIVADDGSEDGTASVVRGYGEAVRYLERERLGSTFALNAGLAAATGDLIAFQDADDVWEPRKLELQVAALARDPDLDLVFCHVEQFHSPELSEEERARIHCPSGSSPGTLKAAMLARRVAIDRVGQFNERAKLSDFLDWYARAQEADLRMGVLPEVLLRRRLHPKNSGLHGDQTEYARAMAQILKRRRAAERD